MTAVAEWVRKGAFVMLCAVVLVACAQSSEPRPAAALAGEGLGGEYLDLERLDGQVVIVTMWASWCGPCRDEVPVLNGALDQWEDHGLAVLGVNFRDIPEAARQFADREGARFPSIIDTDGRLGVSWGVRALPQSFVIDRQGNVVARLAGPVDEDWMDAVVATVVTQQEVPPSENV